MSDAAPEEEHRAECLLDDTRLLRGMLRRAWSRDEEAASSTSSASASAPSDRGDERVDEPMFDRSVRFSDLEARSARWLQRRRHKASLDKSRRRHKASLDGLSVLFW